MSQNIAYAFCCLFSLCSLVLADITFLGLGLAFAILGILIEVDKKIDSKRIKELS